MGWLTYINATGALVSPTPVAEKPAEVAGRTAITAVLGYPTLAYWDASTRGFKYYTAAYLASHSWNGSSYVTATSLADEKAARKALVNSALATAMAAGVMGSKGVVATDEFNRNQLDGQATNMINAVNTVAAPAAYNVMMQAGSYAAHTADEVAVTQKTVVAFIEACKANANTKLAAIDAAINSAGVQAVDPSTGWPGVGSAPTIPLKRQRRIPKLADTTRVSNALVADPDLVVPVEAGGIYHIAMYLRYQSQNALAGFRYQLRVLDAQGAALATVSGLPELEVGPLSSAPTVAIFGLASIQVLTLAVGKFRTNLDGTLKMGAVPGFLTLEWGQNATNAQGTILREGSDIYIVKQN
ncbi:MAG: hypothetical protein V4530_06060 [Pseudomonadota bacterium]